MPIRSSQPRPASTLEQLPRPSTIRERLEENYAEARLLRQLLKLSRRIEEARAATAREVSRAS
jgi:hypothetical protein